MAHHGGRHLPRAHRARAPTMSSTPVRPPPIITAPLRPVAQHVALTPTIPSVATIPTVPTTVTTPVTLQAPRPDNERTANEYVEAPFRPPATPPINVGTQPPSSNASADKAAGAPLPPRRLPLQPPPATRHQIVTKQPVAFTKEHPAAVVAGTATGAHIITGAATIAASLGDGCPSGNIICSECGRCRCASCRTPRPLPQRWVCDNTCLCSADAVIDYASCLCCVKALYYHCSHSDAGATCADEPCSCGPHRRLARWACLGALAAALPCLLCYWPLRGCQRAVEAAYARHSRAGCRCRPHVATPEKRLLDTSPDF